MLTTTIVSLVNSLVVRYIPAGNLLLAATDILLPTPAMGVLGLSLMRLSSII